MTTEQEQSTEHRVRGLGSWLAVVGVTVSTVTYGAVGAAFALTVVAVCVLVWLTVRDSPKLKAAKPQSAPAVESQYAGDMAYEWHDPTPPAPTPAPVQPAAPKQPHIVDRFAHHAIENPWMYLSVLFWGTVYGVAMLTFGWVGAAVVLGFNMLRRVVGAINRQTEALESLEYHMTPEYREPDYPVPSSYPGKE
jgi:hypothetical protein